MRTLKQFLESSTSPNQELINDAYRLASNIIKVKDLLEKLNDSKANPGIKMAIKELSTLNADMEYITQRIEKLDGN